MVISWWTFANPLEDPMLKTRRYKLAIVLFSLVLVCGSCDACAAKDPAIYSQQPQPFPKPKQASIAQEVASPELERVTSLSLLFLDGFAHESSTLSDEQKKTLKEMVQTVRSLAKQVGPALRFELSGWYDSGETKETAAARLESVRAYLHTDCGLSLEIIRFKEVSHSTNTSDHGSSDRAVLIEIVK